MEDQRAAWAVRRWATAAVSRRAVGRCRYSFGPWALLSGSSTPVITNWASGKRSPSIPMNGIDPPSPKVRAGSPNVADEARSSAWASHGAVAGAFQPGPDSTSENETRAPYGGSASSTPFTAAAAASGSAVGGIRIDNFSEVLGRRTLPARAVGGRPSAPTTLSEGCQVRRSNCSAGSSVVGPAPSTNG